MTLYQPQNGWDGKVLVADSGETSFADASELYQVSFDENHNLERRRQLGNKNSQFMPGRYEASGKCTGYFITGAMSQKILGVVDDSSQRSHSARGPALFNLKIDFASYPIAVKAGALAAAPVGLATGTSTVGGVLAAGSYSYRVSAIVAGAETDVSPAVVQVVPAGTATNLVTLTWTARAGATGYRIYGRTAGTEVRIATIGNFTAYTDRGDVVPAGALPLVTSDVNLIGYLLAGCLLATDTFEMVDNTYVEKPFGFQINDIYDIYQGDVDADLIPLLQ